jgi:hypothetical protein
LGIKIKLKKMLNQSFTADNFKNIYDIENRKSSITEYLGAEYKDILTQIKLLQNEDSQIKRKKMAERTEEEKQKLINNKQRKEDLTRKKKEIQYRELENISKQVNSKNFKFDLQLNGDIFTIQNTKEAFFAIKQLQYNIRKTFKVKQASRHLILSQIKLLLNDSSPKYVIRTDIKSFFESIPQDKLLKKIKGNTLLSIQSKKFILQILDDYNTKNNIVEIDTIRGVPRGVGISSYLSELYMKDIDNKINNLKDVVYYARYVDDIFILISPSLPKKKINTYFADIKQIIEQDDLKIHESGNKCNLFDLSEKVTSNIHHSLTYLGYTIHIERHINKNRRTITKATFGLSPNKKAKIEDRVMQSIDYFNNQSKYDITTARKNLLLCLRFITTNTKLSGAKSRLKTGIFYSNDLLDKSHEKDITCLDNKLKGKWLSSILPYNNLFANQTDMQRYTDNFKKQIADNYKFITGFTDKTFHIFSKNELKTIKQILR